jgi:hypothetical protein
MFQRITRLHNILKVSKLRQLILHYSHKVWQVQLAVGPVPRGRRNVADEADVDEWDKLRKLSTVRGSGTTACAIDQNRSGFKNGARLSRSCK